MQMGGNPGDGATLARQTGAAAAAEGARRRQLNEQFSAWAPETMIEQFKQAMAAKPTCIVIMGHPGSDAFHDLVKQAVDQGIVVTDGNSPLTALQKEFGTKGFGYAGVDLYAGGTLTAKAMHRARQAEVGRRGDGLRRVQPGRARPVGKGPRRHAGEGRAEGRPAGDHARKPTPTRRSAVPVLTAYVQSHPALKAIGTQHGGVTGVLADVLKKAGKKPGEITVGGIDLVPGDHRRPEERLRVARRSTSCCICRASCRSMQCVMTAKYKMPGLSLNTGAGVVTPKTIGGLVPLIDAGIR